MSSSNKIEYIISTSTLYVLEYNIMIYNEHSTSKTVRLGTASSKVGSTKNITVLASIKYSNNVQYWMLEVIGPDLGKKRFVVPSCEDMPKCYEIIIISRVLEYWSTS